MSEISRETVADPISHAIYGRELPVHLDGSPLKLGDFVFHDQFNAILTVMGLNGDGSIECAWPDRSPYEPSHWKAFSPSGLRRAKYVHCGIVNGLELGGVWRDPRS